MLSLQGLAVIAALLVAVIGIIWILKVLKATLWAGIWVLGVLLVLYFGFGVTPARVWDALIHLPDHLGEFWRSF
jgi:hypothetical protein